MLKSMQFNSTKYYALLLCCLSTSFSLFAKDAVLTDVRRSMSQNEHGFIENKGQLTNQYNKARTDIQYDLKRPGVSLFLSSGALHYQFNDLVDNDKHVKNKANRMDVTLVGANKNAKAVTSDEQQYTEHYYMNGKVISAGSFGKVTYMDVYPGIDWVVYTKDDKVEYDFIVHDGADASHIKIKYDGASSMHVAKNGGLIIKTPAGEIKEHTPFSYALNTNKEVGSSFSLKGNILSFNIAPHEGPVVIDPQLQWSTYYGGAGVEQLINITTDASGNVYACGYTTSTANIATVGAYQTTYNANNDGFLVKFNANGTEAWATYFGGSGSEQCNGVATDRNGNVYMTGSTTSATGIAFNSTLQSAYGGGTGDAFLAKFNSAGTIQWSTYIGGTGNDIGYSVACDKWRSVYVAGATGSPTAITAGSNIFDGTENGTLNGFINRFDTSGNRIWGTYYGSGNFTSTYIYQASIDLLGYLYFAGQTNASTGIASATAYQSALVGSFFPTNAMIAKFDSSGNRDWGSYYGSGTTQGFAIANDTLGNVYMSGYTSGATNIATAGAYQTTYAGGNDGFLAKFDTAGNNKWGTYYGGTGAETQKAITIDNFGNPMIAGFTTSTVGIATTNNGTYQSTYAGGTDAYIAKFTPLGQRLWGTYFGGPNAESEYAIANNVNGGFYSGGFTSSTTGIATLGAYQTTNLGNTDAYVSRFNKDTFVVIAQPYTDTILCPSGTFNVTYNTSYNFNSGNIFMAQLSDASGSFAAPVSIGSVTASTLVGNIPVTIPAITAVGTNYRMRIIATSPAYTSPDEFVNIRIISGLSAPTFTSNSPVCVGDNILLTGANTSFITPVTYSITGPAGFSTNSLVATIANAATTNGGNYTASVTHSGCPAATTTIAVTVSSIIPPAPTANSNSPLCSGATLNINASSTSSPVTYRITGPQGYISSAQNASIPNVNINNAGYYYITDTLNGCRSAKDSIFVTVNPSITTSINIAATPGDTICSGSGFSFTSSILNGGNNPKYQWRIIDPLLGDTAIVGATNGTWGSNFLTSGDIVYCILQSNGQCLTDPLDTSNKIPVTILQPSTPQVTITASPGDTLALGASVTFSSSVVLGGQTTYQWYVNGHVAAGQTFSTATFHALADSDVVTVVVHNHLMCANPDSAISNGIRVHITTGLSPVEKALSTLSLYPNPSKGSVSLKGHLDGISSNSVQLAILNVIGQPVYTNTVALINGNINEPIMLGANIADGIYLLRVQADGESRVMRFTVQQ